MIFLTGDTHYEFSRFNHDHIKLLNHGFDKSRDYMIVCGDFGLIWANSEINPRELKIKKWLDEKPWITLFLDGNHENFERINALPDVEMFGGIVGKYSDSIFHLKRGEYYTIDGNTFFVMGGGVSIDKQWRRDRISWWQEEMPSAVEYSHALETLKKCNNEVDYVLTHTAPDHIREKILEDVVNLATDLPFKGRDQLSAFLDMIVKDGLKFKHWYYGHYHNPKTIYDGNYYTCLYENIVRLGE